MPRKKNGYATFAKMMAPSIPPHVRVTLFDVEWQLLTAEQREQWKEYANAIRRGDTANCPPLPPGQVTADGNVNRNVPPSGKATRTKEVQRMLGNVRVKMPQKQRSNMGDSTTQYRSDSNATRHKLTHGAAAYDDVHFDPCGFEIPARVHRGVTVAKWEKVSKWLSDNERAKGVAGVSHTTGTEQQHTLPRVLDAELEEKSTKKIGRGRGRLLLSAYSVGKPLNMGALGVKGVYETVGTKQQHTLPGEPDTQLKHISIKKVGSGRGRRTLPSVGVGEAWNMKALGLSNATSDVTTGTANKLKTAIAPKL